MGGWIFAAYVVMMAIWILLCVEWKSDLTAMHGIVGSAIGLGLVESGAWYFYLAYQNKTGIGMDSIVSVLVMFTVLKVWTSYTFILTVSQGWRMTDEILDNCMLIKLLLFGLLWIAINYVREGAVVFRYAFHISSG